MSQEISIELSKWQPSGRPSECDPLGIIDWAVGRFEGQSITMTTAYGMEGIALLHMLSRGFPAFV